MDTQNTAEATKIGLMLAQYVLNRVNPRALRGLLPSHKVTLTDVCSEAITYQAVHMLTPQVLMHVLSGKGTEEAAETILHLYDHAKQIASVPVHMAERAKMQVVRVLHATRETEASIAKKLNDMSGAAHAWTRLASGELASLRGPLHELHTEIQKIQDKWSDWGATHARTDPP